METVNQEIATLAGGCFWCTEAIFKRIKGVASVTSGYTGGTKPYPTYQEVSNGTSGHAEAIQIIFDPAVISYEALLEIFFHLHDPVNLNRQGSDVGTQYRSAIFYHSEEQKKAASATKEKLVKDGTYKTIVTEIAPYTTFFPAEIYHQNFYEKNSYQPYCQYIIDPKIQKLIKEFADEVKEEYTSR